MMPYNEKEILARMQDYGERLIKLGYAKSFVINEASKSGDVRWTDAGLAFKREIQRVFDLIEKEKKLPEDIEFVTFIEFLSQCR